MLGDVSNYTPISLEIYNNYQFINEFDEFDDSAQNFGGWTCGSICNINAYCKYCHKSLLDEDNF